MPESLWKFSDLDEVDRLRQRADQLVADREEHTKSLRQSERRLRDWVISWVELYGLTYAQIGDLLGVSVQRVAQIVKRAREEEVWDG